LRFELVPLEGEKAMQNLTKILEEVVSRSITADQNKLRNFIEANKAEFESAPDEIAVEAILNAAVSANSITLDEKDILIVDVQKSLTMNTISDQPQENAEYSTETAPSNEPDVSELPDGNPDQPASSTSGENTSEYITPEVNVSESAAISNVNIMKPALVSTADSADLCSPSNEGFFAKTLKFGKNTSNTIGGLFWLLALYMGATWLAIGSLSSIQFRVKIENDNHTTVNRMIGLKDLQEQEIQYRGNKNNNEVLDWEGHLKDIAIALNKKPENFSSFLDAINKVRCGEQATTEVCTRLSIALNNYPTYFKEKQSKENELLKAINDFEKNNNISNDPSKPAIKQDELLSQIKFMEKFHYGDMLTMPDQVLTLLLAIAMGVLGSTITMTWTFLAEKPNPPLKWYLLRPFVGALSALVIFIFAKAGQITLTADINESGTLSPFLLSLFGIAAGLLSDRAYAQMSSVSGKVLGDVGAEQERWSSHLKDELEKKSITSEQLAIDLNLDKQQITEIVAGVRAASSKEQQRISDRLGIAPRLLFTDIHP
jgi:hypothetical protein